MEIPAEAARRLVEHARVARLATIARDGHARLAPIVYASIGDALWSPIDGKPKRGGELARVRDVRRDPRVCVLVDGWDERWSQLWWVRIEGHARVVPAAAAPGPLAALAHKYPQYETVPTTDASDQVLEIRVARRTTWAASAAAWDHLAPA